MIAINNLHKILVVDDDPGRRQTAAGLMRVAGYQVMEAAIAQEGLNMASALPDLILLDVNLRDMDGLETVRRFRDIAAISTVPIIHLSSADITSADKIKSLEAGASALVQTSEPAVLAATVSAFLRASSAEKQARVDAEQLSRRTDEFLARAAHGLRSPLTSILGWAELLMQKGLDDDVTHGLEAIARNARAQSDLINDLADISSIASGNFRIEQEAVNLKEVMESALQSITHQAKGKGLSLSSELQSDSFVMGDAARLTQIVRNLLENAVKFTPAGGAIQVALRDVDDHTEIEIADTGCGIEPEFLPNIFDLCTHTEKGKRMHGGLGLNLAITKQLVAMHNGTITTQSMGLKRGASFKVRLPKHQVDSNVFQKYFLGGITVLVVNSDPHFRELVNSILSQSCARVVEAGTVSEALQTLDVEDIQIVVSDDYELIAAVRRQFSGEALPAIAVTACTDELDAERLKSAGFQKYLVKPISPEELTSTVHTLCCG